MKDFGFLIWGISNIDGFKENILSSNEAISNDEIKKYPKDYIRQLCGRARFGGCFYSIEVASNYTFVSIINPETKETGTASERGAYIVISLFLKNGNVFKGEVINTLDKLMDYYRNNQSDSGQINFTDTMFEEQLSNLSSANSYGKSFKTETKIGYKIYYSKSEIESNFKNLNIDGYKRVFFFDKSNSKLDDIIKSDFIKSKYDAVNEFKKRFETAVIQIKETGSNVNPNGGSKFNNHGTSKVGGIQRIPIGLILGVVSLLIVSSLVMLFIFPIDKPKNIPPTTYSTGIKTGQSPGGPITLKPDTTIPEPYNQKDGEYSTMDLLIKGVCVKDSFFQSNPYLYYKNNKWWNGTKHKKVTELSAKEIQTMVNRYADPNHNLYYRCENNTIEVRRIVGDWIKLDKNEQPGIFEYLSAKIVPPEKKESEPVKPKKGTLPTIENCPNCISFSERISKCKSDEVCKDAVRKEETAHLNAVKHGK